MSDRSCTPVFGVKPCYRDCFILVYPFLMKVALKIALVASNLNLGVFIVIANDKIDLNAQSTKVKHYFHSISMTTIQFPSTNTPGIKQQLLTRQSWNWSFQKTTLQSRTLPLQESCSYSRMLLLFFPVCTSMAYYYFDSGTFVKSKSKEIAWLDAFGSVGPHSLVKIPFKLLRLISTLLVMHNTNSMNEHSQK